MAKFTNDIKELDADDELIREGQRTIVQGFVSREMFCPVSKELLDMRTAVVLIPSKGRAYAIAGHVWDDQADDVAEGCRKAGVTLEVYDGRELW